MRESEKRDLNKYSAFSINLIEIQVTETCLWNEQVCLNKCM